MSTRLLVTGGAGFVGASFLPHARALYEVTSVVRTRRGGHEVGWDLSEPGGPCLPETDIVVHLAALTAKGANDQTATEHYRRHNVVATENLLAALHRDPAYFLYVSTADVYGPGVHRGTITEETPTRPQTPYARSKREAEQIVAEFCADRGIPLGVARLGLVYGPGEVAYRKVIPAFVAAAVAGEPLTLIGEGKAKRQFLFVDDAARALLLMTRRRSEGPLNVVGSSAVTIAELARLVIELAGHDGAITHLPPTGPEVDVLYDPARLEQLGFVESVALREGLQREIEWYRASRRASAL
jgi:nucleoside-diphosphate-sugar epimerase